MRSAALLLAGVVLRGCLENSGKHSFQKSTLELLGTKNTTLNQTPLFENLPPQRLFSAATLGPAPALVQCCNPGTCSVPPLSDASSLGAGVVEEAVDVKGHEGGVEGGMEQENFRCRV